MIAVNIDPSLLHREFARVRAVATFWNGLGLNDQEQGARDLRGLRPQVRLGHRLARLPALR